MGVIGGILGFGVGLLLEWYVLDIVLLDEAGYVFPMVVPWVAASVVFAASVTSGDTGYALSSQQVADGAAAGRIASRTVSTQGCAA